jgi:hypothetical protein
MPPGNCSMGTWDSAPANANLRGARSRRRAGLRVRWRRCLPLTSVTAGISTQGYLAARGISPISTRGIRDYRSHQTILSRRQDFQPATTFIFLRVAPSARNRCCPADCLRLLVNRTGQLKGLCNARRTDESRGQKSASAATKQSRVAYRVTERGRLSRRLEGPAGSGPDRIEVPGCRAFAGPRCRWRR